jgi:hypothetical protein
MFTRVLDKFSKGLSRIHHILAWFVDAYSSKMKSYDGVAMKIVSYKSHKKFAVQKNSSLSKIRKPCNFAICIGIRHFNPHKKV